MYHPDDRPVGSEPLAVCHTRRLAADHLHSTVAVTGLTKSSDSRCCNELAVGLRLTVPMVTGRLQRSNLVKNQQIIQQHAIPSRHINCMLLYRV